MGLCATKSYPHFDQTVYNNTATKKSELKDIHSFS